MILRRMLAIWISKATCVVCKLAGKQGVTLAGKIALKIDPKILMELSGQVRKKIFITCGTNGKTTTNNLLCSAIEAEGEKVICNHTGSNMLNGVVSAFVLAAKWNGKLDADYACIEIDEASTVRVLPYFKPDYMILTNLFRDQLDRYGEIDITMELLKKAMHMAPDMTLVVNGDDALSAFLAKDSGNKYVTFGIGSDVPNKLKPAIYSFGLVAVGEKSVIPDGVQIGKNTAVSGVTSKEDYPDGVLESGETLIKAGGQA